MRLVVGLLWLAVARVRALSSNQVLKQLQQAVLAADTEPYPEPPPSSVELCAMRGFACERHEVDTADGYRLAVIHVLGRTNGPASSSRRPVLVQHGMLMSSDGFLLRPDDDNLPLILSDAGYDVWIGNFRANGVSPLVHSRFSPTSFAFWNYSWHEMAHNDLPAMIDLVLGRTGRPSLYYVGHSMGSTTMLVLLSSRPEYNAKVQLAAFLAPVAYVSRLRSELFRQLAAIAPNIKHWLVKNRIWHVFPRSPAIHKLANTICTDKVVTVRNNICTLVGFQILGRSPQQAIPNLTALMTAYVPAGTSLRIMEHYYMVAKTGKFRPLGSGMDDPNPGPEYNMSAVTAPIALYYGKNDLLVYPPDVDHLAENLPNVVLKRLVPHPTFNHLDFFLGTDARAMVYDSLLQTMAR